MGQKDVSPQDGKYKIKGKNNKDLELKLSGNDDDYIVTEFDADLASIKTKVPNLPEQTPSGNPIEWFACYAVYKKDKSKPNKKGGYASVDYTVTLKKADIPDGKNLYAYYNNSLNQLVYTTNGNKITFSLNAGDPPIGNG